MGSKLLRNSEENAGVAEKVDGSFIEDEGSSTPAVLSQKYISKGAPVLTRGDQAAWPKLPPFP